MRIRRVCEYCGKLIQNWDVAIKETFRLYHVECYKQKEKDDYVPRDEWIYRKYERP